jgi:transcription elongation GreA/GreB family factor
MQVPKRRYDQIIERQDPHISEAKFTELKSKLERLKNISRFKWMSEVARLAEMGDFSENHAYQMAKGRLRGINAKILELEDYFKYVVVIKSGGTKQRVQLGDRVTIKQGDKLKSYQVLGPLEADPLKGIISHKSPIGEALMGKRVGDRLRVQLVNKEVEVEVMAIE